MATEASTEFDGVDADPTNLVSEPIFSNRTGANGWFYETSDKASGTASTHCVNASPNTSAWTYTHSAGLITTRYYDICWKVTALPAADTMIFQIRAGGTNRAQIELRADGTVRMKNGTTAVGTSTPGTVVAGQWLRLKWGISGTNQELRIYTDATPANLFGSNPDQTLGAGATNYSQGSWDQFRMGVLSAVNLEVWLDRLVMDDSTWPASGGSGNAAPTANAGPDQDTVVGGTVVTLNGTGSSDPDGTIASYAWTQTSGTTVTLSSSTVASPTFTAPSAAGSATFELRVTDNDGAQSTPDTVVITWSNAPTGLPTSDFYELLDGGGNGVAVTQAPGNSDFDAVDTGLTYLVPSIVAATGSAQATGNNSVQVATHILPAGLVNVRYIDCIFQIDDLASGPWYIMRALSGSTLRASVRVNTNGTVQMRNNLTAVGAGIGTVVEGQPFRVAWHIDGTATDQNLRLFTGSNLYGTSPSAQEGPFNYDQGTFDRIGFGIAAPVVASGHMAFSIPQVEASTWPTPYGASTAPASGLYLIEEDGTFTPMVFQRL